jgi:hypothetical protein
VIASGEQRGLNLEPELQHETISSASSRVSQFAAKDEKKADKDKSSFKGKSGCGADSSEKPKKQ